MRIVTGLMMAGLIAIAFSSLGCESSGTDSNARVTRAHTDEGDVVVHHDVDRDRDIPVDRTRVDTADVARGDISSDVPPHAREVKSVSGRDSIAYQPDRSGRLYVYDVNEGTLIWSGHVDRDQRFTLDPTGNSVTLDGHRVVDRQMSPRHTYRLYFDDGGR